MGQIKSSEGKKDTTTGNTKPKKSLGCGEAFRKGIAATVFTELVVACRSFILNTEIHRLGAVSSDRKVLDRSYPLHSPGAQTTPIPPEMQWP